MGIEPTSTAWEAAALPLSYTRPRTRGDGRPLWGRIPTRVGCRTCLATGHRAEVCTLSGRGDRFIPYPGHYSRAFAFSAFLCPPVYQRPLQVALLIHAQSLERRSTNQHIDGVVTFRTSNRVVRVLPFRRRLLVSVNRPSSGTTSLVPFWVGPTQSI